MVRSSKSALARMHALYALKGLKQLSAEDVLHSLSDAEARVREHAIRLSEPLLEGSPELGAGLTELAEDGDARVRYQLALTLGSVQGNDRSEALATIAAQDVESAWLRFAVVSSCSGSALEVLEKFPRETLERSRAAREFATQLAQTIGRLGSEQDVIQASEIGLSHASQPSDCRALINLAILRGLNQGYAKRSSTSPESMQVSLLLRRETVACLADAKKIALDTRTSEDIRSEAIGAFAMYTPELSTEVFDLARSTSEVLLDGENPLRVQSAAISILGSFRDLAVAEVLIHRWPRLSPQLRSAAIEVLFSRPEWIIATLNAVDDDQIATTDLELARLKQLESSRNQDIQRRARALLASVSTKPRQDLLKAYQPALQLAGDSMRGKALFVQHCAACHRVENAGHEIGPNLAAMAARGPEAILTNVLDP
ncbi:MAG TPA: c-type cytochrome, partial [Burkholderiaceae bacterium]|nr:c-type cytochrome [Burkholderiaceae bacterium]